MCFLKPRNKITIYNSYLYEHLLMAVKEYVIVIWYERKLQTCSSNRNQNLCSIRKYVTK